jgi:hypothetical protein
MSTGVAFILISTSKPKQREVRSGSFSTESADFARHLMSALSQKQQVPGTGPGALCLTGRL